MSRSNYDKPFYVDVGTSLVAVRCASNHDMLMRYDYSLHPHSLDFAKGICDRMNREVEFVRPLRKRIKIAEDALEKIDNMCDGDMCKHFDNTHHCSACRYLDECQTGVAHAALNAIREKGAKDGK